jgi:HSP90 family molecular chaperone
VRRLADEVHFGLSPEDIITQVRELETNSLLWRLKFGCMHYCRFVHHHHTIEDAAVFPMVRKYDPSLNSVVDRLEEDHLVVHHITERIVAAADLMAADPSDEHRYEVAQGLLALEEQVKEVRLSHRLTTSAACLVSDADDITPTLEKMYRAMGQEVPHVKRILELNPSHPLVSALRTAHEGNAEDPALQETAELLYGTALLAEGGDLDDPARFAKLLADRLSKTL